MNNSSRQNWEYNQNGNYHTPSWSVARSKSPTYPCWSTMVLGWRGPWPISENTFRIYYIVFWFSIASRFRKRLRTCFLILSSREDAVGGRGSGKMRTVEIRSWTSMGKTVRIQFCVSCINLNSQPNRSSSSSQLHGTRSYIFLIQSLQITWTLFQMPLAETTEPKCFQVSDIWEWSGRWYIHYDRSTKYLCQLQ